MSYNNPEVLDLYNMRNSTAYLWFKFSNYTQNVIEPAVKHIYNSKYEFSEYEIVLLLSFVILVYSMLVQFYLLTYNINLYAKYTNLLEQYNFTVRATKNKKIEIRKLKDAIKNRDKDLSVNDLEIEVVNNKMYELKKIIRKLQNENNTTNNKDNMNFRKRKHHMILRKRK